MCTLHCPNVQAVMGHTEFRVLRGSKNTASPKWGSARVWSVVSPAQAGNGGPGLLAHCFGLFWLWVALKNFPMSERMGWDGENRRDT